MEALSLKRRQLDQIVFGDGFDCLAGGPPGGEASVDDERVESLFSQQVRHTGAGGLARSSTVKINVFVFGELFDLFGKPVGLDTHRALDTVGPAVVVAIAAHVYQYDSLYIF